MKRSIAIHEEEEETPDPILYDHYGDILSGLGRVEEARRAWEKALSLKADEAIQKKLDGLPAAAAQTP